MSGREERPNVENPARRCAQGDDADLLQVMLQPFNRSKWAMHVCMKVKRFLLSSCYTLQQRVTRQSHPATVLN